MMARGMSSVDVDGKFCTPVAEPDVLGDVTPD